MRDLIRQALNQHPRWYAPSRRVYRGEYCRLRLKIERLPCGCQTEVTAAQARFIDPFDPGLNHRACIRVWRRGSLHGQCFHERCGRTLVDKLFS